MTSVPSGGSGETTVAVDLLPDDMYKAAVDALYKARNDGKVMDEAAAAVARAVLALDERFWRDRIADEIGGLVGPCFELNFDGTEDKERSAYVEGLRAAHNQARGVS